MTRFLRSTVLLAALSAASPAVAQRDQDVQLLLPTPAPGVTPSVERVDPLPHLAWSLGMAVSYAREPLVRRVECPFGATVVDSSCLDGEGTTPVVTDLAQLEVLLALGLYDRLELGVAAPMVLARVADDLETPRRLRTQLHPGDYRTTFKAALIRGDTALGFRVGASLPTGHASSLAGSPSWSVAPALIFEVSGARMRVAARVEYRFRERVESFIVEQDDELGIALGAAHAVSEELTAFAQAELRVGVGGRSVERAENPLEGMLGLRLALGRPTSVSVGFGGGVPPGHEGYGAPLYRITAIVRYQLPGTARIADRDDDSIADSADACPVLAEDRDGFADADGCPDPDNDADGVMDRSDRCPLGSEDHDGFQDDDGCADLDDDADAIPDGRDRCRLDPEDMDGFEDEDGCPESGPLPATVTVTDARILVSERIYFDFGRDTIRAVSMPVLDEVASGVMALPAGVRVRIEGHTDAGSSPDADLDLSVRRAQAVRRHLVGRGVPDGRLEHTGHGGRRPLAPNDTPEGRALNRRVEFSILR